MTVTRSNPHLSQEQGDQEQEGRDGVRSLGGRRQREEVTSRVQPVNRGKALRGGEARGASSPPTVTVTVGTSTRIHMNTSGREEIQEMKGREEGHYSLPNLSLLRAEARGRRPHMGTARYVKVSGKSVKVSILGQRIIDHYCTTTPDTA
jgi:hypothetical protein